MSAKPRLGKPLIAGTALSRPVDRNVLGVGLRRRFVAFLLVSLCFAPLENECFKRAYGEHSSFASLKARWPQGSISGPWVPRFLGQSSSDTGIFGDCRVGLELRDVLACLESFFFVFLSTLFCVRLFLGLWFPGDWSR